VIERVKKNGVSQAELDKARRSMLSNQISGLATARGVASDLGSNWLLTRNTNFSKDYLDAIARVTAADLQRVAREYLRDERLNVTSLNPIGTLAKKAGADTVASDAPIKKFTLPNGLRLLVREDPRLPLVSVYAAFRGGLLAESPATNGITRLFSRAILKGTKTRSAAQIAEQIDSAGGSIGADSGNNSFSAMVEVMKPDLGLGLDILADVLLHPVFPATEVELEKSTQIAAIKAEDEQVTAVARNAAREKLFGTHPYALRNSGSVEAVQKLTPADLKKFHETFAVAKNGVIAVFGDVKAEDVLQLAEKAFGSMPSGELALSDPPQPEALTTAIQAVEERNKQQAIVMIAYPGMDVTNKDRVAMELLNEASNDLGSRFFNRIREKLGLAYFVGAGNFTGLAPGCFIFYLGTDPAKVDKVIVEFQDEINHLATDGLTPEELARAKKKLAGSEAIRNQSNSAFAASVAVDELVGLGYDRQLQRKEEIDAVSLEDVRRVANKYFSTPARVEVIVRPPAKTASAQPAPTQS
nr:insulinase family protein [Terrimicrobiaceae bacterium]